jgi:uncharacterized Rmd1/YagE family protein
MTTQVDRIRAHVLNTTREADGDNVRVEKKLDMNWRQDKLQWVIVALIVFAVITSPFWLLHFVPNPHWIAL